MSAPRPKTELRGLCSYELAQALDAIALSKGIDRSAYVNQVLEAEVKKVCHEASLLNRVLDGNPFMSEAVGSYVVSNPQT